MDLGNLIETIVYYLLIEKMTCLGRRWDGVPMVSVIVCIAIHWTRLAMNHDVRLSDSHDLPSYYVAWTLNLERIFESMLKSIGGFDL